MVAEIWGYGIVDQLVALSIYISVCGNAVFGKAMLKMSVHLHICNYVNQAHHTINTGESREVKIKIYFA